MNNFYARMARFAIPFLLLLATISNISAQLPTGFIDAKVQGGYVSPMGIVFSKDGQKMFVWEKKGTLWVSTWNGTTYVKQGTVSLNISEEVGDWRDFGFQSVALDPNFDTNGLIYLFYQVDRHHLLNFGTPQYNAATNEYYKPSISRVTRYKLNNNNSVFTADYASRKVLLGESKSTGVPLVHESHAGGQIVFGADGTLLVTTGDNASYASTDVGSAGETYWQQAIADGIMRSQENVGALRAQMLNSHCGKLLRLDPNTGDGVSNNPHFDAANPRSAQSRVWALGLRNPYRMSFKTGTGSKDPADGSPGTFLIADVQWNTWEDMHMVEKAGTNCGWPIFEGIDPAGGYYSASANVKNQDEPGQPSFQSLCKQATSLVVSTDAKQRRFTHFPPALDWRHGQNNARYPDFSTGTAQGKTIGSAGAEVTGTPFGGNAATSGTFYPGTAFPVAYRNVYFFADYGANWIKAAELHDNSNHQVHSVLNFAPDGYCKGVVDIEYCPFDQSIFYVNINTGDIQKVSYGAGNRPPVAVISADKTSGISPLTVNFSSVGTNDPDGNPLTYLWNFGDGTTSTAANPQHVFTSTGLKGFTVTLTVKDNGGLTDTKTLQISTNNTPPSVKITNPANNSTYTLAQATQIAPLATVTDNDAVGMQYAWQLTLRHNTHEHREPIINQQAPSIQISPVGCDGETYYYMLELIVTDNGGLSAKDSVKIYPDCNSANISITNLAATPGNYNTVLTWQNPSTLFDEVLVAVKEGSGFIDKPNGTTYTADANFTGAGTAIEGGKVVYRGTSNTMTVTSLTAGKTYYFRVYTRKGTTWTGGVQTSAVPTGVVVTPQAGCLKGSYFNNIALTGTPSVIRAESSINYDWGTGNPTTGINADNFSARWEGIINPPVTGAYTFTVVADDGVRLWVNNALVLDKWIDQAPTTYNVAVNLTQAQNIPIKMEFYERGGGAVAKLNWTIPNQASQVVGFSACAITQPPPPVAGFEATKCYRLTARHSAKVLEIVSNSTLNGTNIQQNAWNGGRNQVWRLKSVDGTFYRVLNGFSGKAMDVSGVSTVDGANIHQWDYLNGGNQQWKFDKNTEGYYFISAKHSNKVADVYAAQTTNGANVIQWTRHSGNNQQWTVAETACPVGTIALQSAQIYAVDGYRESRKAVITWVSNADAADYFEVEKFTKSGNFEKISTVNALSLRDISSKNQYSFVDNQPFDGENIYRVKLIFGDNFAPQLSGEVKLDFNKKAQYTLYPNPSSDYIDVDIEPLQNRTVLITVLDAVGHAVKYVSVERADETQRVELDGLPTGQYVLRIHSAGLKDVTRVFNITK